MAAAIIVAAMLGGCAEQSLVVDGSTVTVASAQAFTSANDNTAFGNTPANTAIVAATSSGFSYYDDTPALVRDESFGHYEIVSEQPFSVEYTVNDGVLWSDGAPIDGADLLLAWAANSGVLNSEGFDPGRFVDLETGQFEDFPEGTVYFDGASRSGLQHVSELPELGADGRSITLVYDEYFADWELAFEVGLPAHAVVEQALTVKKSDSGSLDVAAKTRLIDAVTEAYADPASAAASDLSLIAAAWNSDFNLAAADRAPFVSSGPYTISAANEERVTLVANPEYSGDREPRFETVVMETITDPLAAVNALRDGEVDVISPIPTTNVIDALDGIDDVTVLTSGSGQFEHLDLQFSRSRNGSVEDPLVREAFLLTIPRAEIVDELVAPLTADAAVRDSFVLTPGSAKYGETVEENGSQEFAKPEIAEAKRLLKQAGVASPVICVLFDPANPRRVAEFTLIQESAAQAGFQVTDCSKPDWEEFLGVNGAYDAALFAWNESTDAVSSAAARLQSGSTISNFSHYANPVVDELLASLAVETDAGERATLLADIDAELWEDAYGVPLYQFPSLTAVSDSVRNVSPSALSPGLTWNLWEWQPAPKGT